jgi:hypothetical protein
MGSELAGLNFVIAASLNNSHAEPQNGNQTDETLMNKGFQRTMKKLKAKQNHGNTLLLSMNFKK